MALRHMLEAIGKPREWFKSRMESPDPTPLEVSPRIKRPISSLEDMRRVMLQIQKETAEAGNESFEDFYDFGEDGEDEFEAFPAPAQMKHDAIQAARDRDYEAEVVEARRIAGERLRKQALDELKQSLEKKED